MLYPPEESVGLHTHLFRQALSLRRQGVPERDCVQLLRAACETWTLRREIPEREIEGFVAGAFECDLENKRSFTLEESLGIFNPVTGWPANFRGISEDEAPFAPRLSSRVVKASEVRCLDDLRARSAKSPRLPLRHFFKAEELVCCGREASTFRTLPLQDWSDESLENCQFVVPNPMRKRTGVTKRGSTSHHCRDAVGARRFLIVEFDNPKLSPDKQASLLWELNKNTRGLLAMAVSSGGKSVHGWVYVGARAQPDPRALRDWFCAAVRLGADPRMWFPEQFARMPGGLRDNGKHQEVLFFNPLFNQHSS